MRNPPSPEVVVITGASAGVGRAVAREFGRHGAHIGLLARGRDALEAACREVESLGGKALALPTDVSHEDQVEAAAEAVERAFGPIDVWVNNAMVSIFSPFIEIKPEEFRHITEVTYLGQVWGTRAALRRMLLRDAGHIVQVGSALAHRSIPLQSAYCGAKHAIEGFTESIRTELIHAGSNVVITVVELPGVNTTQFEWTKNNMPRKPKPVGKVYQPEVIADAIYYAAHTRRKEIWVGWPTVESIVGEKVASAALDHYLADKAWSGSLRDTPRNPDAPDDFWQPVPGDHGARGPFDDIAVDSSAQLWLNKRRSWVALAAFATAATATYLLSRRTNGRHERRAAPVG